MSEPPTPSPKVSVVIPAYNASKYIREAIDSVINQSYRDYEIIVVDGRNGSTDNTKEIVAEYGDAVRYFHQDSCGLSDARNKGILNSKGEYIAFLDSDDLWLRNKLALQVQFLDDHQDIGLVFCDSWYKVSGAVSWMERRLDGRRFFEIAKPHRGEVLAQLLVRNFIPVLTVLVRRKCLLKAGLFNLKRDSAEDYDLWLRVSRVSKIDYIDKPLAIYRLRSDSLLHKTDSHLSNLIFIKNNLLKSEPGLLRRFTQYEIIEMLCPLHVQLGNYFLAVGEREKARGEYRECLRLYPYDPWVRGLLSMTFLPIPFKRLSSAHVLSDAILERLAYNSARGIRKKGKCG